jgi:hypothetical protein
VRIRTCGIGPSALRLAAPDVEAVSISRHYDEVARRPNASGALRRSDTQAGALPSIQRCASCCVTKPGTCSHLPLGQPTRTYHPEADLRGRASRTGFELDSSTIGDSKKIPTRNVLRDCPSYGWINRRTPTNPNTKVVSAKYAVRLAKPYSGRIMHALSFARSHQTAGRSHVAQRQFLFESLHPQRDYLFYRGASQ